MTREQLIEAYEKVLKVELGYEWILCAEYKTLNGFVKWAERFM